MADIPTKCTEACCTGPRVELQLRPEEEYIQLAAFYKVFGDPTRLKILWALDESELCVCAIAELLSMSKSAVSHQLAYLRQNRLVSFRREGKTAYYRLADDHIKMILDAGTDHINE
ncbi:MAG: metalloregulator ArsR/SmtB family transcription factor [Clostridiales bacterium]|nr:metalloregulator ArsR/SmtB family transcription factor [Clostridiales bacterium]